MRTKTNIPKSYLLLKSFINLGGNSLYLVRDGKFSNQNKNIYSYNQDMSKTDSPKTKNEKISICELMKEDTSQIIQKLESQTPSYFQQYSDLYSAYLHTLDDVFGTCYISEKEFFDKLNIDQGILKTYQKYSKLVTDNTLEQIEVFSKIRQENIKIQIASMQVYDNFIHSMMDSYAKFLGQVNRYSSSFMDTNP